MKKLLSTLCLVASISVLASGCENTSESYARGANRDAGTVVNDATITTEIKSKLLADSEISGFKIDVDTYNGIVTLTGPVPTSHASSKAVDMAKKTTGVKQVISKLVVRP